MEGPAGPRPPPLREPAPQAVADRLAELGADVWAVALDLANARLAVEREALEKPAPSWKPTATRQPSWPTSWRATWKLCNPAWRPSRPPKRPHAAKPTSCGPT
jgi:hypothetical protein